MKMENNTNIQKRYMVIPRTLVFIKRKEKYLLIKKNNKESFGFSKYNGVGGHIEKGEEPFNSALREVNEETGLEVGNMELAAILFVDNNINPGIQVFIFKADYAEGEILNSEEGILCWMAYVDIKKSKNVLSDVPELIHVCRRHKKGAKPIILQYHQEIF
jgi:8-oxo-dGTP diphosphatase